MIEIYNEAGQLAIAYKVYPLLGVGVPGAARPGRERERGRDPAHQARERGLGARHRGPRAHRAQVRRSHVVEARSGERSVQALTAEQVLRVWERAENRSPPSEPRCSSRALPRGAPGGAGVCDPGRARERAPRTAYPNLWPPAGIDRGLPGLRHDGRGIVIDAEDLLSRNRGPAGAERAGERLAGERQLAEVVACRLPSSAVRAALRKASRRALRSCCSSAA